MLRGRGRVVPMGISSVVAWWTGPGVSVIDPTGRKVFSRELLSASWSFKCFNGLARLSEIAVWPEVADLHEILSPEPDVDLERRSARWYEGPNQN